MKKTLVAIAAASTLALTACASESNTVTHVDEVADMLADTSWACEEWTAHDDDLGRCGFRFGSGTHSVHMTDDPEMMTAISFDNDPAMEAAVVGENWVFACGSPLVAEDCEYLAGLMDSEMIERGHWSD